MRQLTVKTVCVGVWLALVGVTLHASNIKVKVPPDLGNKIVSLASKGEVPGFIDIMQAHPYLQGGTTVDGHKTILDVLEEHDQAEMIAFINLLDRNSWKKFKVPPDLGSKIVSLASKGEVQGYIDILQAYPYLQDDTVVDDKNNTILHVLAEHNQAEMIAFTHLLGRNSLQRDSNGFTIESENNSGQKPLDVASSLDNDAAHKILTLIRHPNGPDGRFGESKSVEDIIAQAVSEGEEELLRTMVEALVWKTFSEYGDLDAVVNDTVFKALDHAIRGHHNSIFDYLVALLPDNSPVLQTHGLPEIIIGGKYLLDLAIKWDNAHAAKYYFDRNDHRSSPIWRLERAAEYGAVRVAAVILLEEGVDVNSYGSGKSPIQHAFLTAKRNMEDGNSKFTGQLQVAKLLAEHGAKLSSKDKKMLERFGITVVQEKETTNARLQAAHAQ